jgi:hypothetical protein
MRDTLQGLSQRTWIPAKPLVAVHNIALHRAPVAVQGTHTPLGVCTEATATEESGLEVDPIVHVAHPEKGSGTGVYSKYRLQYRCLADGAPS